MNPQAARFLMQEIAAKAHASIGERQELEERLKQTRVEPNSVESLPLRRFSLHEAPGNLEVVGALHVTQEQAPEVPVYRRIARKVGALPQLKEFASSLLESVDRRYQLYKTAMHHYVLLAVETVFDRELPDGRALYLRTPRILGVDDPSVRRWEHSQRHSYLTSRFLPHTVYGSLYGK